MMRWMQRMRRIQQRELSRGGGQICLLLLLLLLLCLLRWQRSDRGCKVRILNGVESRAEMRRRTCCRC